MPDVLKITAEEILKIKTPELIFTHDRSEAKKEYRLLVKQWHPDRTKHPLATDVIANVTKLYDMAVVKFDDGTWEVPGLLSLRSSTGGVNIRYKKKFPFELGMTYVSDRFVTYVLEKEHKSFFDRAKIRIETFKYANDNMKKEVSRYLPTIKKAFTCYDGKHVLVIEKTEDLLLLRDVFEHLGKKFDPRHAAWVMSRLHGILCYFQYADISHNDISLDTVFISPKFHTAAIIGGWWYSVDIGRQLKVVPRRTFEIIPPRALDEKVATTLVDSELSRAVVREILGDIGGTRLLGMKVPRPFVNWISIATKGDAFKDFKSWQDVLDESFGERKFVKLEVTSEHLYGKE